MNPLQSEARAFLERKQSTQAFSMQLAALFLASGIDLEEALRAPAERRREIRLRVERLIERERQRGAARHWSYDLNRHIALKQALLRIIDQDGGKTASMPHSVKNGHMAASGDATVRAGVRNAARVPGGTRPPENR